MNELKIIETTALSMDKGVQSFQRDLAKMRTGKASATLIDGVQVDYYGSMVPVSQVANITTPDARTIQVVAWEAQMLPIIEKAFLAANLGFTPQNDGKCIRIPLPALTEDRRKEMVKLLKKAGEEAKVAVRNIRRESNEEIKKFEKAKTVSEDESKKLQESVQKKTDERIAEIDKLVVLKEKEIMTI